MPLYDANAQYDPILTNFSVGYEDQSLIGATACPLVPVSDPAGKYAVFDRSTWLVWDDRREPGAQATEIRGQKWAEDNYTVKEHAVQVAITDEERQNFANSLARPFGAAPAALPFVNPETDATALATRAIMLRYENDVSAIMRSTGSYAGGNTVALSGTSRWDDYTGVSNPIKDIEAGMRKIFSLIYQTPNLMIVPWEVWSWIRNHPAIVDRIKYHDLTEDDAFLQLTGFQGKVVVPSSVYNTANNPDATEAASTFWGKDVILAKVDTNPQLNTKTFIKGFSQVYDNGLIRTVDRWREQGRWSDVVACKMRYDTKIVSNVAGYLIQTAIS
jgi:hypothetical protein